MTIGEIWEVYFQIEKGKKQVPNSKNKDGDEPFTAAFKWIQQNRESHGELLDLYLKDKMGVQYLYMTDIIWKDTPYNFGSSNMSTKIEVFWAIVY